MGITGHGAAVRRGARLGRSAVGPLVLAVLLVAGLRAPHPPLTSEAGRGVPGPEAPVRCQSSTSTPILSPQVRTTDTLAVVRTPRGEVRVVSFERGWAVYNGLAPGTFLRVCRA